MPVAGLIANVLIHASAPQRCRASSMIAGAQVPTRSDRFELNQLKVPSMPSTQLAH